MTDQEMIDTRKKGISRILVNLSIIANVFACVSYVFIHDLRLVLIITIPACIYLYKHKATTKDEKDRRDWVQIKSGTFLLLLPAGLILLFFLYFIIRVIFPEILKSFGS